MRKIAFTLVLGAALSACMSQADTGAVEAAVTRFHENQAQGDDQAIYDSATADFRNGARLEDLARLNNAVRGIQGCSAPARDPAQWRKNMTTSGTFITVVYTRQCDAGGLTETFVYRMQDGFAGLLNYNVAGMALFPTVAPAAPAEAAPEAPPAEQPAISPATEAAPT